MSSSYNVQHAPIGALDSFTLGSVNRRGGFASQVGRPGESNVYIGYREGDGELFCLPYFETTSTSGTDVPFGVSLTYDTTMRRVFGSGPPAHLSLRSRMISLPAVQLVTL